MKKVLLLCAVLSVNYIFSQEIKYGIKGGTNFSNLLKNKNVSNSFFNRNTRNTRTDFHVGAFMEIPIGDQWSIQPELLYSRQGANFTDEMCFSEANGECTISQIKGVESISYISMPILFKYKLFKKFNLEFGPHVDYAVSANVKENYYIDGKETKKWKHLDLEKLGDHSFMGAIREFDLGLSLGASYDINEHFFIQGRYKSGFAGVIDLAFPLILRNSVFQFSLGYKF